MSSNRKQQFPPMDFPPLPHTMNTLRELTQWIEGEQDYYHWLHSTARSMSELNAIGTHIQHPLAEIRALINSFDETDDPIKADNYYQGLTSKISLLTSKKIPTRNSPTGKAIDSIRETEDDGDIVAAFALSYLVGITTNYSTRPALRGALLIQNYLNGQKESINDFNSALEKTQEYWKKHLTNLTEEHSRLTGITKDSVNNHLMHLEELKSEYEEQISDQIKIFSGQIEDSNKELTALTETYDKHMATKSSVSYWLKKHKSHKLLTWVFGVATLMISTGFVIGFYHGIQAVLTESIKEVPLWKIGFTLALSSTGIWLTRLCSKIFISNLHLMTDASERITMTQTYLALIREDNLNDPSDRQLILQTLFRPSMDGFIKDDQPSHLHNIFAGITKKQG